MKNRIALLILFIFMTILIVASQTHYNQTSENQVSDELKQKYGSPNTKGQYEIRVGIGLTAKFKNNNQPIEMLIEPLNSSATKASETESSKVMLSGIAEEAFNELVPVAKRGKKGNTTTAEFGCTSVDYTDYEQVMTSIAKRCEQQGAGTYSISVRWKK